MSKRTNNFQFSQTPTTGSVLTNFDILSNAQSTIRQQQQQQQQQRFSTPAVTNEFLTNQALLQLQRSLAMTTQRSNVAGFSFPINPWMQDMEDRTCRQQRASPTVHNESSIDNSSAFGSNNTTPNKTQENNASKVNEDESSTGKRGDVDRRKLFVGNLPAATQLEELLFHFQKFGKINKELSVVKDQNYAFIHFVNEEDAKVALSEMNNSLFKDRYIRVQHSTSQGHMKKSKTFHSVRSLNEQKRKDEFRNPTTPSRNNQSGLDLIEDEFSNLNLSQNRSNLSEFGLNSQFRSNMLEDEYSNASQKKSESIQEEFSRNQNRFNLQSNQEFNNFNQEGLRAITGGNRRFYTNIPTMRPSASFYDIQQERQRLILASNARYQQLQQQQFSQMFQIVPNAQSRPTINAFQRVPDSIQNRDRQQFNNPQYDYSSIDRQSLRTNTPPHYAFQNSESSASRRSSGNIPKSKTVSSFKNF